MEALDPADNAIVAKDDFTRLVLMTEGYKMVADLAVAHTDDSGVDRDILVVPILFNYRQFLELSLKYQLATHGGIVGIDANGKTHDLAVLWASFREMLDRYGTPDPDEADPVVDRAFASVDREDIAEQDWNVFASSVEARQILDEHFRDLGVRIGIVQPRSGVAKHKHIELQADTLRVLAFSLLEDEQVLTMPEFAERLRSTWSLVVGAGVQDGDLLRSNRFGPLDRDDDLRPNAAAFEALLIRLGLAVEPSDGLTLVAINAEELI